MKPTEAEYNQYNKLLRIMVEVSEDPADLKFLCNHAESGSNVAVKIISNMLLELSLPSHRIAHLMGQIAVLRQLSTIAGGVGFAQTSQIQDLEKQFNKAS